MHNLKCRNMQQSQKHSSFSFPGEKNYFLIVCVNPFLIKVVSKFDENKILWCAYMFHLKNKMVLRGLFIHHSGLIKTFWLWQKGKMFLTYFENIFKLLLETWKYFTRRMSILHFLRVNHLYPLLLSAIIADVIRRNSGF